MKRFVQLAAFGGLVALCASQANAELYTFTSITWNNATDATNGAAQLTVDVTDAGAGLVLFTFQNTGSEAMIISDVYFEDGSLLGIASLIDADDGVGGDANVDFSPDASPGDLPGSGDPVFVTKTPSGSFSADSDPPPGTNGNGVDEGESLGILVNVSGSFQDVLDAIERGMDADTYYDGNAWTMDHIRIGIHVQGFDGGGSESFVNTPIPAPGAMLLGAFGLGLVGWYRRRTA